MPCPYLFFFEIGGQAVAPLHKEIAHIIHALPLRAIFQFIYWPFALSTRRALNVVRQFYTAFEPYTSPYSYANLVDYDLGAYYLSAYYGSNIDRLIQIKNTYDPNNIFKWRQGIPLEYVPKSILRKKFNKNIAVKT